MYYRNARQYWVAGIDLYRERNRDDKSDSFNRYALRTTWGQEWPKGLSTVLRLSAAQRHYQAPSFFSNEQNRRDKEASASLSVWHRALHFKGITPRLTIAHNKNMEQRQVLRIRQNQNVCRIEQNVLTNRTNLGIKQKYRSCILIYKADSNFYRYRINRIFKA